MIPDIERRKLLIKLREHLESLAKAGRSFWNGDQYNAEDYFEAELVRTEDFLKEGVKDADL